MTFPLGPACAVSSGPACLKIPLLHAPAPSSQYKSQRFKLTVAIMTWTKKRPFLSLRPKSPRLWAWPRRFPIIDINFTGYGLLDP